MRRGLPLYSGYPRQCTPANRARVHIDDSWKLVQALKDFFITLEP